MKIYISGDMTGVEYWNFGRFFTYDYLLRQRGWEVLNPAVEDLDNCRNPYRDPPADWSVKTDDYDQLIEADCRIIEEEADAMFMLEGWMASAGAAAENRTACRKGIPIFFESDGELPWPSDLMCVALCDPTDPPNDKMHVYDETHTKHTNPKDAIGASKPPLSTVSAPVMFEIGLGMLEGAMKYGRHNYRVMGVRASVYYDATLRHLTAWWEGEDIDPDSQLHHLTKALASLTTFRDAMLADNWRDDRPPKMRSGWLNQYHEHVKRLLEKYPNPKTPYTESEEKTNPSPPAAAF